MTNGESGSGTLQRLNERLAWIDRWLPWIGLLTHYAVWATGLWSIAASLWSIPKPGFYGVIIVEDPAVLFIFGLFLWGVSVDGKRYNKKRVFGCD